MIETYIQKGEAVLIHSDMPFDTRNINVRESFKTHPDITIYAKEKVLIEDVRDFTYEMQKEGTGEMKLGILVCDDISISAQPALLKILEDIDPDTCIVIYTHAQAVFLPTILSRVIVKNEQTENTEYSKKKFILLSMTERFEMIKQIMKEVEDEKLSKQDVVMFVEDIQKHDKKKDAHKEVYVRAFSMLKQPSVSVKYVLEYVSGCV